MAGIVRCLFQCLFSSRMNRTRMCMNAMRCICGTPRRCLAPEEVIEGFIFAGTGVMESWKSPSYWLSVPRASQPSPAGKVSHAKLGGESAGLSQLLIWAAAAAATEDRAGGASRARRQEEKSYCSWSCRLCGFLGLVRPARPLPVLPNPHNRPRL